MKIFKHIGKLLKELMHFAWQNKAWWIIPIFFVLIILTLLIAAGQVAAPFIYTLF